MNTMYFYWWGLFDGKSPEDLNAVSVIIWDRLCGSMQGKYPWLIRTPWLHELVCWQFDFEFPREG